MPGIPMPGTPLCSQGIPMPVFASWGLSRTCPKECNGRPASPQSLTNLRLKPANKMNANNAQISDPHPRDPRLSASYNDP
jgi:hypothetical protein